eukprot:SAG11_NODE_36785_length_259_cov_290.187500_1_plen_61_part_01
MSANFIMEWIIYQSYKNKDITYEQYNTLSDEEIMKILFFKGKYYIDKHKWQDLKLSYNTKK